MYEHIDMKKTGLLLKYRIEKVGYSSINAFIVSAVMEKLEKEENF